MSQARPLLEDASGEILIPMREIAPLQPLIADLRARDTGALAPLFAQLGDGEDAAISLADVFRLLHEVALDVGEETFRLSARPMVAGTAELVFTRAGACATVGEAIREIARAYNVMHGDNYNRVDQRGRTLAYVLDDDRFPYTRPRDAFLHFTLECTLIYLHGALCELADEDLTPFVRRVSTRRLAADRAATGALALWDTPVGYGAGDYSITYDAAVAARPLSHRRRHLAPHLSVHGRIISLIEAHQAAGRRERVAAAVQRALHDGLHGQEEIAARLKLSTATLRRRLADEGANFRELHRQVLHQQARTKLLDSGDIGGVADSLGFSDTRSFTRAFKSWTGLTPSAFLDAAKTGAIDAAAAPF